MNDSIEDVKGMFMRADKAGDTASAKILLNQIDAMQAQQTTSKQQTAQETKPSEKSTVSKFFSNVDNALKPPEPGKSFLEQPGEKSFGSVGSAIGKETVFGGITGAAASAALTAIAPEALMAVGAALEFGAPLFGPAAPLAEGAGLALAGAGESLRATRLARIGSSAIAGIIPGAVSGAASETAGQGAEMLGASKGTADAVRLGTGLATGLTPELATAGAYIGKVFGKFVPDAAKAAFNFAKSVVSTEATSTARAVSSAQRNLVKSVQAGVPEHYAFAQISKGMQAAEDAANSARKQAMQKAMQDAAQIAGNDPDKAALLVKNATANGNKLVADTKKQSLVLQDAFGDKIKTVAKVRAFAKPELAKVGETKELTDIGNSLRSSMTQEEQQALAVRAEGYHKADLNIKNIVAEKEAQGQYPGTTPAMKELTSDLEKKLRNTPAGREAAGERITIGSPSIKAATQRLYDSVTSGKVGTGKFDEAGDEIFKQGQVTIESLRQTSRELGERAYGSVDTGFAAMGQKEAQAAKKQVDKVIGDYVGDEYKAMQTQYAHESGELAKYGTSSGKAGTAQSRVDPQQFIMDAAKIPDRYFKSSTGVKDLIELTGGNKELVAKEAASYSVHEMTDMSSDQAKKYIQANNDWIREVPGLNKKLSTYADSLNTIENNFNKAGSVLKNAEKSTTETFTASQKASQIINKEGFTREETVNLVKSGSKEDIATMAKYVAGTPEGKQQLSDLARVVLSKESKQGADSLWNDKLFPLMKNILPAKEFEALNKDAQRLISANEPKKAEEFIRRIIKKALISVTNPYLYINENSTN